MSKKFFAVVSLLVLASMVLAACAPTTTTVVETVTVVETQVVEVEVGGEPITVTMPAAKGAAGEVGGWVDQIAMSIVSSDNFATQIEAGAIDLYAGTLATPQQVEAADAIGLERSVAYGLFYELTFNPECAEDGTFSLNPEVLNPFCSAAVREAVNWLVDRDQINREVYGGLAIPKFTPVTAGFPDYAKYVEYIRPLETYYAYDFDKANAAIEAAMAEEFGVSKGADGFYSFNGAPVEIVFLIRTDSDGTRVPMGNYVANQLEAVGIKVDRQYKTSSEASPYWIGSDPAEGSWHLYTGAWIVTGVDRDQGDNFQFYYSPNSVYGSVPLWASYPISEEASAIFDKLANNDYTSVEEREELFAAAFPLTFETSVRVWMMDGRSFSAWRSDLAVAFDLGAGVDVNALWPYTLKFDDSIGGSISWGNADLFVDPANPLAGSNWTYDTQWFLATNDAGTFSNPFTGLALPQRIERAEVTVQTGLPVDQTYDWVTLSFEDTITVPADAWIDWNPETETFVTVGEAHPDGLTALRKSVVYYPESLFTDYYWHDGSPMTVADFVMGLIMVFAPGTEGSNIYDEAAAGNLEASRSTIKGWRIVSESPLVIETYSDFWSLDAENNVTTLWPFYGQADAAWHAMAVANLAEENGELAYSADKADANEIEWTNFIGGPSLGILNKYLGQALDSAYIPYEPTMGQYVTAEEAQLRYAHMQAFFNDHGHFWIGSGPYILDEVFLVEKTLTLVHNPFYPDPSSKWGAFAEPKFAEAAVEGPGIVAIGEEAAFDVYVTFKGEAYPAEELSNVKYLVYDAEGGIVEVGEATFVSDGLYQVVLSAELTGGLASGSNQIEIAVVSREVSVPTFVTFDFVTE